MNGFELKVHAVKKKNTSIKIVGLTFVSCPLSLSKIQIMLVNSSVRPPAAKTYNLESKVLKKILFEIACALTNLCKATKCVSFIYLDMHNECASNSDTQHFPVNTE